MITIEWKGKIGYGDIISPLCYAHNIAQKNCDDVTLHMHWKHKRGELYKPEDKDTLDGRLKFLWSICKPVPYHKVHLKQTFNDDISWNHTNYDDQSEFHNLWWSRIKNLDVGKPYVVMNTTAGHKEQFSDYDPDKQWKDPVGLDKWLQIETLIKTEWGFDVVHSDYTDSIGEAVDKYRKAFLAIGYHGSTAWVARYLRVPMVLFSTKKITKSAFPWALVKSKYEEGDLLKMNPHEIRNKGTQRIRELEKQIDIYLNTPNIHRLRGKRT
jgi:hypothetical protein